MTNMKKKLFFAMLLGAATITASAQGYTDGIEYYKAGQFSNAITLLERNLDDPSTDKALSYYYLGQAYAAQKNVAKAKECFEKGIAADPNCGYNYVGLGALDLLNKNKDAAEDNFKKAQSLAKKNTEIIVDIARAYYNADPVAYADKIEKFLSKARKDSKYKEPAIYIFEGDRKFDAQDYNGAVTEYQQAITFDEDNPEGYVKYANTYYYVVPEYAIEKLKEFLLRRPNSALAQRELAEKYYETKQWTLAARQYGDYINNPNHFPEDKARYAVLLLSGEQFDKALTTAEEVLAYTPNDVTLQRIVIRSLDKLDRKAEGLERAKAFFSNPAISESINAADYRIYAGLLAANNDSTGLQVILKGIEKFPQDALLYSAASDVYYAMKDYHSAADYMVKAIENTAEPKNSDKYIAAQFYANSAATALQAANNEASKADSADNAVIEAKLAISKEDALKGVALMNQLITDADSPWQYLYLRGRLYLMANKNVADSNVVADFEAIINQFNKDPENANPQNPKNQIKTYVTLYGIIGSYYKDLGDEAKTDAIFAEYNKFVGLRDQIAQ